MVSDSFVQKQYIKFSEFYEKIAIKRGHFQTQINLLKQFINSKPEINNILDAACATGNVIDNLSNKFTSKKFCGSDLCEVFIEKANNKYSNTNESFLCTSWGSLNESFTNNKFDLVFILGNSIMHVCSIDELMQVFLNVKLILSNNGYFLFDFRAWEKNQKEHEFNLPYKNPVIEFDLQGNNYSYKTTYKLNDRHCLEHDIQKNGVDYCKINLSFLKISINELIDLLEECGFCNIKFIKENNKYPYHLFIAKKCK